MAISRSNAPVVEHVPETAAAEYLGLCVSTLRTWRWRGTGPRYLKFGRAVRYSLTDLRKYVEEAHRNSTSETPPANNGKHSESQTPKNNRRSTPDNGEAA
jgi:hypothetical protein